MAAFIKSKLFLEHSFSALRDYGNHKSLVRKRDYMCSLGCFYGEITDVIGSVKGELMAEMVIINHYYNLIIILPFNAAEDGRKTVY